MTDDASRQVRIRSLGLSTALGDGLADNVQGLRRGEARWDRIVITGFAELEQVPYLSVGTPEAGLGEIFRPIECAVREALAGSGLSSREMRDVPLYIGSTSYLVRTPELLFEQALAAGGEDPIPLPTAGFDQSAAYLRDVFGLRGPEYLVNTACAASANALLAGTQAISSGRVDHALVLGLELFNLTTVAGFFGMQLMTNDVMRPFDRRRSGLILGEGCGVILLSVSDGHEGGLFVAGGASAGDTHSITASNPDGSAIADVMHRALARASVAPEQIRAIKAHGTASPLNDDGEAAAMHRVFARIPAVFGLKPYVGHTLGGCGAIELALFAAAYQDGFIPLSAGFELRDEQLDIDPLTAPLAAEPGHYMANFFGFGGNNSTVILTGR